MSCHSTNWLLLQDARITQLCLYLYYVLVAYLPAPVCLLLLQYRSTNTMLFPTHVCACGRCVPTLSDCLPAYINTTNIFFDHACLRSNCQFTKSPKCVLVFVHVCQPSAAPDRISEMVFWCKIIGKCTELIIGLRESVGILSECKSFIKVG